MHQPCRKNATVCPVWNRTDAVLQRLNGAVAKMLTVITKRDIKKESSSKTQSWDVKRETTYQCRKWTLTVLRSPANVLAKQELLSFADAAR